MAQPNLTKIETKTAKPVCKVRSGKIFSNLALEECLKRLNANAAGNTN